MITGDGTLGTTVKPHGNVYTIARGTRPDNGPNLFHSFGLFNVGRGDIARFRSQSGIQNILSRVTGGQRSDINGQLQSTRPGVNLYLLNPSGVVFGPRATLDVRGSFHVSTANVLRLADGGTFVAHLGEQSTLTTAPPVAFGFLQANPPGVAIHRSQLQVDPGKAFSIVGGNVEIVGGCDRPCDPANVSAPGGRVYIASLLSAGAVPLNPAKPPHGHNLGLLEHLGAVTLAAAARLDVSSDRGGTVVIRGGQIHLTGSTTISSKTLGAGTAGAIRVHAAQVRLTEGAQITSSSRDSLGPAGTLEITATDAVIIAGKGPELQSGIISSTSGDEHAGLIRVSAPLVRLEDGGILQATTARSGRGGSIEVRAEGGQIILTQNAQILSTTAFTLPGGGRGGDIHLVARTITISEDTVISAESQGTGRAGVVRLTATEAVRMMNSTVTTTATNAVGGNMTLTAPALTIIGGTVEANTVGTGDAGSVTLNVGKLQMSPAKAKQQAQITSSSTKTATGAAGRVTIQGLAGVDTAADMITLSDSALLTRTEGRGPGGDITLHARTIRLTDAAAISAASTGTKNAGTIRLTATDLLLSEQSAVTTEARRAQGGAIRITAQSLVRLQQSKMTTSVLGGDERGGNITINSEFMVLQDSPVIANAVGGRGGNIRVRAEVFLADPVSVVRASSIRNIDGEINIQAPVTNLSNLIIPLPQTYMQVAALQHDQCAARLWAGTVSSFVVRGRPGVPTTYDGVLPSRLYEPRLLLPTDIPERPPRPTATVPPAPTALVRLRTPPCKRP